MNDASDLLSFLDPQAGEGLFGPVDVVLVAVLSVLLTLIIAKVYQVTHRGVSYSQGFIHSLFLMSLCTGVVMMIIGSNIARAFSLVGALSIIRFRTAVKDVRDTAFLFFSIVVGMGCGTEFYLQTTVFTLVVSGIMYGLHAVGYAIKQETEEVLKIRFRRGSDAPDAIESYLGGRLDDFRLINSIRNFDSEEDTHVYVVRGVAGKLRTEVTDGLAEIDGVTHAALYVNDQQIDL